MTVAAVPARETASRPALLPWLVPTVSLAATAGMATSAVAFLPAAAALIVLAVVAAAAGRRRSPVHLGLEPLGMAFMLVLAALHGRAEPIPGHAHGAGWLSPVLTVTVVALSAACLVSALRHVRGRVARARVDAMVGGASTLPYMPGRVARAAGVSAPACDRTPRSPRPSRPALAADVLACVSAAAMCAMAVHMLLR
jgi:hypothetical protein